MSDVLETMREYKEYAETKSEREAFEAVINEITTLRARLAPVDDERLREIAAKHVAGIDGHSDDWDRYVDEAKDYIDAIRPHIEAAERERCIKAAKGRYEKLVPANEAARNFRLGRMTAAYEIEGKFKPSKTPPDTNTAQIDVREFVEKLDAPQQSGGGNE